MILRTTLTADGDAADPSEIAELRLHRSAAGLHIEIDAPFHGNPPPPSAPGSLDGLWAYEVVELFIATPHDGGWHYTELEFSPHGHSLALRFNAVRVRTADSPLPHLESRARVNGARWTASVEVPAEWLPAGEEWRVNANAIHGAPPRRYLTAHPLGTPPGKPDFHRPDHFGIWAVRVRP